MSRLRKLFPTANNQALLAAFPGLSLTQIKGIAWHSGIYRKRRPFKETGIPVINQLRERAFALNMSMVDLDGLAGTKKYFQKGGWHAGHINHRAIARAAHALDGLMAVQWKESA